MPKATITFSLPEERDEYRTTMKAAELSIVLSEYDNFLRGILKYGSERYKTSEELQVVEELRLKLNELRTEYEVHDV